VTIIIEGSPKELQPETSRTANLIISDDEKIPNIEARIDSETEYFVKLIKKEIVEVTENKDKKNNNKKKNKDKNKRNEEDIMIEVGERTQNNIEILGGLKENDRIRVVPVGEEEDKKKEE